MMLKNLRRSLKYGLAHSARWCCPFGRVLSIDLFPVSISSRTTPKLYTSLFELR
jgi:hypothetical protein